MREQAADGLLVVVVGTGYPAVINTLELVRPLWLSCIYTSNS